MNRLRLTATVAHLIRTNGYACGTAVASSTGDIAWDLATTNDADISMHDVGVALRAARWASRLNPADTYEARIQAIASRTDLRAEDSALAAALVQSYLRVQERCSLEGTACPGRWVGVAGSTVTSGVVILSQTKHKVETSIGKVDRSRIRMRDHDGAQLLWFAAGTVPAEMVPGATLTLSARVKRHSEYRGCRITELSHCKILENKS